MPPLMPVAGVVGTAVLTTLLGLMMWTVLPALLGWRADVVISGSMEPGIRPGDVVVTAPAQAADVLPGQVVLVENPAKPGALLLHRAVGALSDGSLVTRGDANATADTTPVPAEDLRGLPRLRIPAIGLPVHWLRQGHLVPFLAALGAVSWLTWASTSLVQDCSGVGPRTSRPRRLTRPAA